MKLIKSQKYTLKYNYYATEDGKIYSEYSKKFLTKHLDKDGYEKVRLVSEDGRHTYSVHRLILETFNPIENSQNKQVNHKDGDKQNNNLQNLEWVSCSENQKHAHQLNLKNQKGQNNNQSKLTESQVLEIIELILSKQYTLVEIGKKYGVCGDTIGAIKNKHNWTYLTKDINFN